MAKESSVIDSLSDERKAVAIDELITRIQQLSSAALNATARLNEVKGERASIDGAKGLAGLFARGIIDKRVAEAQKEASSVFSELQAARLKMVNLTGSRITNFKHGVGESDADAIKRLGAMHAQYRTALSEANKAGALVGQDYIDKRAVDATATQFLLKPGAKRFQDNGGDKAADIVKAFASEKMTKFAAFGAKYFSMANPMLQKVKPFVGRNGGINLMGGLRALGPWGRGVSAAIALGKKYLDFNRKTATDINNRENQALMSGLSAQQLSSFGVGLGAYGGDRSSAARLTGGIAMHLGGMRYGQSGGNLMEAARMFGLNITGSGYGGLATTEEILMRMSSLLKNANGMQKEQLVFMARSLGLSADQVRMMQDGPEKFAERMHANDYISRHVNNPEAVQAAEETSAAFAEFAEAWGVVWQQFINSDFVKFILNVGTNLANAIMQGDGFWGKALNVGGWALNTAVAPFSSIYDYVKGTDMEAQIKEFYDSEKDSLAKAREAEEKGDNATAYQYHLLANKARGQARYLAGLSSEGWFTATGKTDKDVMLPETMVGSTNNMVYNIEPIIKVEQTVNVEGGSAEDANRIGEKTAEGVRSGFRGVQNEMVGSEM